MGQNKNPLSKTSFDHNLLEKLFFVFIVQLQQHQETAMEVMGIQFVEIQLVSNPILITVKNITPVKKMAKASFFFIICFLLILLCCFQ